MNNSLFLTIVRARSVDEVVCMCGWVGIELRLFIHLRAKSVMMTFSCLYIAHIYSCHVACAVFQVCVSKTPIHLKAPMMYTVECNVAKCLHNLGVYLCNWD